MKRVIATGELHRYAREVVVMKSHYLDQMKNPRVRERQLGDGVVRLVHVYAG